MGKMIGKKICWTGGWMGIFIWVFFLSLLFFSQAKYVPAFIGMGLWTFATACIIFLAPWRFAHTPYWKLMLSPYILFFCAAAWCVWSYGGMRAIGLKWWDVLWFAPIMLPFGFLMRQRWTDYEIPPAGPGMNPQTPANG